MENKAIVRFQIVQRKVLVDIEVPLDISAEELIGALNEAYSLGISREAAATGFLVCEQPTVQVRGGSTLRDLGIRDGSILRYIL
ncbi:MAG: EsaB/YukD family protein [Clostridiales bacterium]|nr:EsaB/YukD family protein [Clostridiales bacterium]